MVARFFESALGAAGNFSRAARHLAWFLSYCVDASATRNCDPPAERSEPYRAESRIS